MGETMKLAVPTMGEAGLESERAGHFGHCDCFTVVEIADGEITGNNLRSDTCRVAHCDA